MRQEKRKFVVVLGISGISALDRIGYKLWRPPELGLGRDPGIAS
jgi:hypothetical protein